MRIEDMKIGQVVTLNSGGPPMTVCFVSTEDIGLMYFRPDGKIRRVNLYPAMLSLVTGGGQ